MKSKTLKIILISFSGLAVAAGITLAVVFAVLPKEHEHRYVWSTVREATCLTDGEAQGVCECGDTASEILPATGHNYVPQFKDSTCTEEGYSKKVCSFCGDKTEETVIPKKEHDYVWVTEEATCTEEGYSKKVCSFCGDKTEETVIPKKEHDYVWVTEEEATCRNAGKEIKQCSVCGYKGDVAEERTVAAKSHSYEQVVEEPTCEKEGSRKNVCSVCGDTVVIEILNKKPHQWDEGVVQVSPKCAEKGKKLCKCGSCGAQEIFDIDALGHDFESGWTIDRYPTVDMEGEKSHHCQRPDCGERDGITPIEKLQPEEKEITYRISLKRTTGEALPLLDGALPSVVITDGSGGQVYEGSGTDISVKLFTNQNYTAYVSGLPAGFNAAEEGYVLTPSMPDMEIKIPASPQNFTDETHGRYYIGSVIYDDPFDFLGEDPSDDGQTSFGQLLKQYKGIFVNLYFNSCSACNFELPYFIDAYNSVSAYGEKYSDEIAVVMINVSDSIAAIRQKKIDHHIPMITAANQSRWFASHFYTLAERGYPTSVWIDCEGVVVGSVTSALYKNSFIQYFELLINRYYQINGMQRPDKNITPTAIISEIDYFVDARKRKII